MNIPLISKSRACRRSLILALIGAILTPLLAAQAERPNVIVVMTDDQGYGELSCHGNPVLETPHLDRLHASSVRFTDFHVAPMCTPTRGQMLTGRDAARSGAINVSSGRTMLRAELPTMADILAENGYRTGLFGKWHLGDAYPYRPQDRGFQEVLWFPSSHINSVPDYWNNDYFDDVYLTNDGREAFEGYCTDVFFREAMDWMEDCAEDDEPFFCFIPTNAAHWPHWVPDEYRQDVREAWMAAAEAGAVPEFSDEQIETFVSYLAMIRNIDDNMGKLKRFLEESGLLENTLVIFTTDNGTTFGHLYYNAGMRGHKTELWEGGHRVPLFVSWPQGDFGHPRDIDGLTQVQDLFPTILEACGIDPVSALHDGMSLLPVLRQQEAAVEDRMLIINYSRMPIHLDYPVPNSPSHMQRDGAGVLWRKWRLLWNRELYNLETDPGQQNNVIGDHPEVAEKMRAHLYDWWKGVEGYVNEPLPVVIGHPAENPTLLTGCEWLDVFVDQQIQVRAGVQKNSWWEIQVAEAGEYEFELRRWPRESGLALAEGAPSQEVTDGHLIDGRAFPIAGARLKVGDEWPETQELAPDADKAVFTRTLPAGRTRLYTWFIDEHGGPLLGAYYVYVNRK